MRGYAPLMGKGGGRGDGRRAGERRSEEKDRQTMVGGCGKDEQGSEKTAQWTSLH